MTIFDTSLDFFFAHLICDYIKDPSSILAGVPDNNVLPKEVMDLGKVPDFPSMVFAAKENGGKGARRIINVSCLLLTWLKSQDAAAAIVAEQTPSDVASGWINAVDLRLHVMLDGQLDDSTPVLGFKSWLASLPDERRAGWRLTRIVHNGLAPVQRNSEKQTLFYATTLDLHVALI